MKCFPFIMHQAYTHLILFTRTCPECAYIGFIDQQYPWIKCSSCKKKYCTSCDKLYHKKKTCEEARKEAALQKDPKHRAHEAMSQACKRFCPHCSLEYMKSDGCNKMKCSNCKTKSCYLCGKKIKDYSHFCQHKLPKGVSHCNCGKTCRLWTSTSEMEQIDRSLRQAAGRKALIDAGITDEKEIKSIIASPSKKKSTALKKDQRKEEERVERRVQQRNERREASSSPPSAAASASSMHP